MIKAKKISQYISEIKPPWRRWVLANHFSARGLGTNLTRTFIRRVVRSINNTSYRPRQFLRLLIIPATCHQDPSRSQTILWTCDKSIQITVRIKNILIRSIWNYQNETGYIPKIRNEKSTNTVVTWSRPVTQMTPKPSL